MARGDEAALSTLMARHGDRLMAVAWRMVGDRALAEDMVQETFIKSMKQAPRWQSGKALFGTWMHRVLMNQCYDHLRKAGTKREISGLERVPERVDEALLADEKMVKDELAGTLLKALEKIPVRQRQAIILCHYEDRSNAEAAEILSVSVEAVESLLARGRRSLRARLEAAGINGTP